MEVEHYFKNHGWWNVVKARAVVARCSLARRVSTCCRWICSTAFLQCFVATEAFMHSPLPTPREMAEAGHSLDDMASGLWNGDAAVPQRSISGACCGSCVEQLTDNGEEAALGLP